MQGSDDWNPVKMIESVAAPQVEINGNILSWTKVDYAINYIIMEDNVVIGFTTDNSYTISATRRYSVKEEIVNYTVMAVSEYGALSVVSNPVEKQSTTSIENETITSLQVSQSHGYVNITNIPDDSSIRMFNFTGALLYSNNTSGNITIPVDQNVILQINTQTGTQTYKLLKK